MKQINPFLMKLLNKCELRTERVLELLSKICDSTDDLLRIFAYISGSEDLPEINEKHLTATENYTFKSYDILSNKVTYVGEKIETRWFKTKEEADAFFEDTTTYESDKVPSRWRKTTDYPYEGKAWVKACNDMLLENWNN